MKKKKLLGILAVLMVFALALTGCGQQGEQNAGATGSESQNEAIGNEDNSAGEVTTELEETPGISQTGNQNPTKDVNGNYIYLITVDDVQTEIKTCVNVWDYITDGTPYDQVDLNVSAKYSCGFPDPQVLPIIVVDRYLDYFTTIMEDRLWQVLANPVFRWRNRSGLSMNAAKAA